MNIQSIKWLLLGLMLPLLVSCGGGGGSPGFNPNARDLSLGGVSALTVLPGESRTLLVSGGVPPYQAVSAETSVAVAAMDGSSLVVGGIAPGGSTVVTVSDRAGTSRTLNVTVGTSIPLYTTAPASLQLGVGPSQARVFRVGGGLKPYTVTSNVPLVAAVTQLDAEQWRIEGLNLGETKVRIRDAAGKEIEVTVVVGSPELRISSENLTLPVGVPATVALYGGQKPYSIVGGIPAAVQVRALPGSDHEFEILGLLVTGDVDVVFADATGKLVKTKVTINAATTQIRVSPSAVTVAEASGSAVRFGVWTGARGALTVLSSFPALISISEVVEPEWNPDGTLKNPGSFLATVAGSVCVSADTAVTLTVIDRGGSVGTAVINVRNTNPDCPAAP